MKRFFNRGIHRIRKDLISSNDGTVKIFSDKSTEI